MDHKEQVRRASLALEVRNKVNSHRHQPAMKMQDEKKLKKPAEVERKAGLKGNDQKHQLGLRIEK